MKLYKEFIGEPDEVPPPAELVMESPTRSELIQKAEDLARAEYGLSEHMWLFEGRDSGYRELQVADDIRLVIRS